MRVLGAAAMVAGVPVATVVVLMLMQQIAPGPALATITATLIAAVLLATRWCRDLAVLTDGVRRITADEPMTQRRPELPGLQRLGADLERLGRRMGGRAGLIEQLRRADATVVERLPDPLIVLREDRSVQRANSAARAAF